MPNNKKIIVIFIQNFIRHLYCIGAAVMLSLPAAADDKVQLEADRIEGGETITRASGNVKATFKQAKLCAGEIMYDRSTGLIKALHNTRLIYDDVVFEGDSASYNLNDNSGSIAPVEGRLGDSQLRVNSKSAHLKDAEIYAEDAYITSCPPQSQDWLIHAGEVTSLTDTKELVLRDVTLEVADIPVFYLPYSKFYYGKEKQSGFLWPNLRLGSSGVVGWVQPYYIALADNYDLTITPNYQNKYGLELQNSFRFLTPTSRGDVQIATALFDGEGRGREQLDYDYQDGFWKVRLQADNVSDDDYLQHYDHDDSSTRILPRRAYVAYERSDFYAAAAIDHYKNIDSDIATPYRTLPQLEAGVNGGGEQYDWDGDLQYSRFIHNTLADGDRLLMRANGYRYYHFGDTVLSPAAGFHAARHRSSDGSYDAAFITPYMRLDAEKTVQQLFAGDLGDHDYLQLRSAFVYAPARTKQNDAPLYDTTIREQTAENLFEWNRFVGGDRATDAKFIAYGGSYYLFDDDGNELFYIGAAQRYHLSDTRIVLADEESPPSKKFGNILINSRLQLGGRWSAAAAAEWLSDENTFHRFYSELYGRFDDNTLLHIRYLADQDESLIVGAGAPVSDWLDVVAKTNYLMDKDRFAQSKLALRLHDSCNCWNISFTVSDKVVDTGSNDTEYAIGFTFIGLGNVGNDYDSLLDTLRQ